MGKVTVDMSMSLDGFIAGPNDSVERPLGEGGERLHQWLYDLASWRERHGLTGGKTDTDAEVLEESFKNTGAVVVGRRMFDVANGWGDNPPFHLPLFVITHGAREKLVKEGERRSPSSPAASKAPLIKQVQPLVTKMSRWQVARTSFSST